MNQEFRRSPRRQAPDSVMVTDTMTEQVIGRLGNLSQTGMLLIASEPLVDDALYQFRFNLPGIDHEGSRIEVGAHLLWFDRASAPGQCWAGLRFIAVPQAHSRSIRRWIEAPGSHYV